MDSFDAKYTAKKKKDRIILICLVAAIIASLAIGGIIIYRNAHNRPNYGHIDYNRQEVTVYTDGNAVCAEFSKDSEILDYYVSVYPADRIATIFNISEEDAQALKDGNSNFTSYDVSITYHNALDKPINVYELVTKHNGKKDVYVANGMFGVVSLNVNETSTGAITLTLLVKGDKSEADLRKIISERCSFTFGTVDTLGDVPDDIEDLEGLMVQTIAPEVK